MKPPLQLAVALLVLATSFTGCKNYATVRESRPFYAAASPSGEIIAHALKRPAKSPEAQIGRFIDAASVATKVLAKNPSDAQALKDYAFAVSRIFDVLHKSGLEPWEKPIICPGVGGDWTFSVFSDGSPERNPSNFRILPADRFVFRGKLVGERAVKEGLGAPMVISALNVDATKHDPFIQGRNFYYGITQILRFNGRHVTADYVDPLSTEDVAFAGHIFPVAADFSAPISLALAELRPRRMELLRMFKPGKFADTTRLARFQPYDPKKIPIIFVHGLGDSQSTWAPMIEGLRVDPVIRKNYQIWFFTYDTGFPYPLMASVLREKMDAINAFYPDHRPVVVVGHSMGGMIARQLITDSGSKMWDAIFETPPEKTPMSPEAREIVTKALFFKPRPEISRVIFMSASLRGAYLATSPMARFGAEVIAMPGSLSKVGRELAPLSRKRADGRRVSRMPTSLDVLDPNNRFLLAINEIPVEQGIPYNSIIADRGKGGNKDVIPPGTPPESTDGLVAYWSSHIAGAQSELIVPSGHWSNRSPQGIAEVDRILREHLEDSR